VDKINLVGIEAEEIKDNASHFIVLQRLYEKG
jgi:hypothetical protein